MSRFGMCRFGMYLFGMCRSQTVPPRSPPCHPPAISAPDLCHSRGCPRDGAPEAIKNPRFGIWVAQTQFYCSAGGERRAGMVPWDGAEPSDPAVWDSPGCSSLIPGISSQTSSQGLLGEKDPKNPACPFREPGEGCGM